MPLHSAKQIGIGLLASTLAVSAQAQSFRHAPAGPHNGPIFSMPSMPSTPEYLPFGRQAPPPRAAQDPQAMPSMAANGAPGAPQSATIPPHLTENTWTRRPESIPEAPMASGIAGPMTNPHSYGTAPPQSTSYYSGEPVNHSYSAAAVTPTPHAAPLQTAEQLFASTPAVTPAPQVPANPDIHVAENQTPTATPPATDSPIQQASYTQPSASPRPSSVQQSNAHSQPPVPPGSPSVPSSPPPSASTPRPNPTGPSYQAGDAPGMTASERRRRGLPPATRPVSYSPPITSPASQYPAPAAPAPVTPPPAAVDRLPELLAAAQDAMFKHDFALATHHLDEARKFSPQDPRPEALRARLHETQGQWKEAVVCFDRLVLLEPTIPTWKLARGRALFRLGDHTKAVEDFRTVEMSGSRLSLTDYTLMCEAAFRNGDGNSVAIALAKIEQINPQPHPRSELIKGLMAFRAGQAVEARRILLRASARWPRDQALNEALRRTSAVYYRDQDESEIHPVAAQFSGVSELNATSMDLVEEFTPEVQTRPETTGWRATPRETTTTEADAPQILSVIESEELPAPDGWRKRSERQTASVDAPTTVNKELSEVFQIVPAGFESQPRRAIGNW